MFNLVTVTGVQHELLASPLGDISLFLNFRCQGDVLLCIEHEQEQHTCVHTPPPRAHHTATEGENMKQENSSIGDSGDTSSVSGSNVNAPPAIPFPFEPYEVQTQLMRKIYDTLENGRIGVFESPTGTVSWPDCLQLCVYGRL